MGVIALRQRIITDRLRTTQAFRHVLSGHLEMDAAGIGAFRLMHVEYTPHLFEDVLQTCFGVPPGGFLECPK